eukprot:TRINITY_DN86180_c0_g1_i1.p1 TRINITY_DN86180_c0_g1~~TRINITY_DN86180_c0_g1_i1.p1  ORF type:complete len:351 (+),score=19.75 TRINITY_DN86180_c0_g1_i1:16-1068(+)
MDFQFNTYTGRGGRWGRGNRGGGGRRGRGNRGGRTPTCWQCGEPGHVARDCTNVDFIPPQVSTEKLEGFPTSDVPFIDTHAHIDYIVEKAHCQSWTEFLARNPMPSNYQGCITQFCDSTAIISDAFSMRGDLFSNHENVWGAFGLHPHNAKHWTDRMQQKLIELNTTEAKAIAWGEIGIDYSSPSKGGSPIEKQLEVLEIQLQLAVEWNGSKPIVIHCRDGEKELMELLKKHVPAVHKLHLHAWSCKDPAVTQTFLDAYPNCCIGLTGALTFNNSMVEVVKAVPMDRFVLETDAPYMLPKVMRNEKTKAQPLCHPGYIMYVAQRIAEIKGITLDEVLLAARANTNSLYDI